MSRLSRSHRSVVSRYASTSGDRFAPTPAPFAVEAVEGGGGAVVSLTDDPEALVWLDSTTSAISRMPSPPRQVCAGSSCLRPAWSR